MWQVVYISSCAPSPWAFRLWSRKLFCPLAKITHLQQVQKLLLLHRWKKPLLKSSSKLLFATYSDEVSLHSCTTERGLICWKSQSLGLIKGSSPGFFTGSCIAGGSQDMQQRYTCAGFWLISENRQSKPTCTCWRLCRHTQGSQTVELLHVASPPAHTETVK